MRPVLIPRVPLAFLGALSALLTGCQSRPSAEAPRTPASAAVAAPVALPVIAKRADEALPPEAASTLRVVEAISRAGVPVGRPAPSRAGSVRARYCSFAATPSSVGIAVCEYGSVAAAIAGRKFSLQTYSMIKNREVVQRGSLTLTVTGSRDVKTDPEARKALEVFRGL